MAEAAVSARAPEALETADMQGLVARAYGQLPVARYVLGQIGEPAAARAWLAGIADDVFTADGSGDDQGPCLNLALTWEGLRALELPADALATFPRAVREGMVSTHRSRILGDLGPSDPSEWWWGGGASEPVHVVVMIFARDDAALETALDARRRVYQGTGALIELGGRPIVGRLRPDPGTEHFGFADGLSQPLMKGWPAHRRHSVRPLAPAGEEQAQERFSAVEPGEIVLGYNDNFGAPAQGPTVADRGPAGRLPAAPWAKGRRDLGRNGSFLVFRQLAQDVPAFHRAIAAAAGASATRGRALTIEQMGAKVVGRWARGAPVVLHPELDPGPVESNEFGYHDDPHGLRCPLGAHVRRSNPRDSSEDSPEATLRSTRNHRILRRGRPFGRAIADPPGPGEEPDAERGLLFLCLNTDVERQFEFIQHTWLNNPFFAGLDGEIDPISGGHARASGPFTIPDEPVRRKAPGLGGFVTTRGGAYFFLPGIRALRYLGAMA